MAEKQFNLQANYGWGLSLNMTGKAPEVAKRIFNTYDDAFGYANDADDSAIEGLVLTVVNDPNGKNGAYFVKSVRKPSALKELKDEKDIQNLSGRCESNAVFANKEEASAWADSFSGYTDCFNYSDSKGVDFSGRGKICKIGNAYYELRQLKCEATELVRLSTVEDNKTSADAVAADLADEIAERKAADSVLSGAIDANTSAISVNSGAIATEKSEREAADSVLSGAIDANTSAISVNSGAIATEKSEREAADSVLSGAIDDLSDAIEGIDGELSDLASANTEAHEALDAKISANTEAIAAEAKKREDDDKALDAKISANTEAIAAEAKEREDADTYLSGVTSGLVETLKSYKVKDVKEGEKVISVDTNGILSSTIGLSYDSDEQKIYLTGIDGTTFGEGIDASDFIKDGMLKNVELVKEEGKNTQLVFTFNTDAGVSGNTITIDVEDFLNADEVKNLENALNTHKQDTTTLHLDAETRAYVDGMKVKYSIANLDNLFSANTQAHSEFTTNISNVTSRVEAIETTTIPTITANVNSVTSRVDEIETTTIPGINNEISSLKAKDTELEGKISANTEAIAAEASARTEEIATLTAKDVELEGKISANTEAIAAEAKKREDDDKALDAKISANTEAISANTDAISANTDAISALNAKVEGIETTTIPAITANVKTNADAISALSASNETAHTTLQGNIDTVSGKINTVETNYKAADEALHNQIESVSSKVAENEGVVAAALTDLKATKVSSVAAEEGSNIVVNESKSDNGVSYTLGFQWLTF
jgi:hypothetical protein